MSGINIRLERRGQGRQLGREATGRCARGDGDRIAEPVHVARGESSATRNPSASSRWRCLTPVSSRLMGTPAKTRASGRRSPIAQ